MHLSNVKNTNVKTKCPKPQGMLTDCSRISHHISRALHWHKVGRLKSCNSCSFTNFFRLRASSLRNICRKSFFSNFTWKYIHGVYLITSDMMFLLIMLHGQNLLNVFLLTNYVVVSLHQNNFIRTKALLLVKKIKNKLRTKPDLLFRKT